MVTPKPSTLLLALALALAPAVSRGQAGVLLVEGEERPDSSVLALAEMEVSIRIDHLHAEVEVIQVFENRTARSLRGRYELALGQGAAVSSFAVWEGEHRREATVVERARGRRIFEDLTRQDLDPGLLETSDQGPRRDVYTVQVDPIGAYGRVRLEVGYSQDLSLAADEGRFVFPLAARGGHVQRAGRLRIEVVGQGAWPLEVVEVLPAEGFAIEGPDEHSGTGFRASFDRSDVTPSSDLQVIFRLARTSDRDLRPVVLTYRDAAARIDRSAFGGGRRYTDDRGYFVLRAPVQLGPREAELEGEDDLVIALDTSLSMRGSKLERAVAAVEALLDRLGPEDRFTLVTFNDQVRQQEGGLASATDERLAAARRFFRESYLSAGTDLRGALPAALRALQGSEAARRTVVLITDGQPSLGSLEVSDILRAAAVANDGLGASRARVFALGVGDDANHGLLDQLAQASDGLYIHAGEGADVAPVLRAFLHQLGAAAVDDMQLDLEGLEGIDDLYPPGPRRVYDGAAHVVWGRYAAPSKRTRFRLHGRAAGGPIESTFTGPLPRRATDRRWIARGWARQRVEHLLRLIDADGERSEWVDEVVALAREHLLVTPYTSLIAAARSLLRPREIQPGDPVLRVRTDPADRAVTALFPFGLVKPLRQLEPGLFETRFLAPTHLADGRHEVDLVVTGPEGRRVVRDHFIIDSSPPRPHILPLDGPIRAGSRVPLRVRSDRDTRRLHAFLRPIGGDGPVGPPAPLRWSDRELACVGELTVVPEVVTGAYEVVVIAEDHAHNVGSSAMTIEVLGR